MRETVMMNDEARAYWDGLEGRMNDAEDAARDALALCGRLTQAMETYESNAENDWVGHWLENAMLDVELAESSVRDACRYLDSAVNSVERAS